MTGLSEGPELHASPVASIRMTLGLADTKARSPRWMADPKAVGPHYRPCVVGLTDAPRITMVIRGAFECG